jgi:hypothetical protein
VYVLKTRDIHGWSGLCSKFCAKGDSICIPVDYSKFDPPNDTITVVNVGIDIKDIPKAAEKDII